MHQEIIPPPLQHLHQAGLLFLYYFVPWSLAFLSPLALALEVTVVRSDTVAGAAPCIQLGFP